MNNDIISILNFKDENIECTEVEIIDDIKYIHITKKLMPVYCPLCGARMYSRGIRKRNVNHPILQDGYRLILVLHQRKWKCASSVCGHYMNDEFTFVERFKRNTTMVPYLILFKLKDLKKTAAEVAREFNVSDTYVHNIVLRYLDCRRLPLPEILAVDEVHLEFNSKNRYALVLMDFMTGEIVDILPNRLKTTYESYFLNIPREERAKVKVIVCDMYNPYINFAPDYFRNCTVVIDSFHVIQWINNKINIYINEVKKKYQKRDRKLLKEKNEHVSGSQKKAKMSREVYLLTRHRWVLLKSMKRIDYSLRHKKDSFLNQYLTTYQYEGEFLALDSRFHEIRKLKEKYIEFNDEFPKDPDTASKQLDELISEYSSCSIEMFREFAGLLKRYRTEIINSFRTADDLGGISYHRTLDETNSYTRRISNGPIEGYNRKPKDFKRNSRGFRNIDYTINRLIWASREHEPVLAIPKDPKDVATHTGISRGPYNKGNGRK